MPVRLVSASVVITARQFNPSIFTQVWVKKNLGVADDDFLPTDPQVANPVCICLTYGKGRSDPSHRFRSKSGSHFSLMRRSRISSSNSATPSGT